MVARSGLFVAPLPGTPPVGTAPTDARLVMGGLFGLVSQVVSGGLLTPSPSTMAIAVGATVWQLPDVSNALATFFSATDATTVTPAAGPGTGSRVDLVCVKQNNFENADADSRANVIIVAGTAGAPGLAPAVPSGYFKYAQITVPTSAANAAACSFTYFSTTTFLPVALRALTLSQLNLVTGVAGQHATVTSDATTLNNGDYSWVGSAWKAAPGPRLIYKASGSGSTSATVDGSFTSLFTNYRVIFQVSAAVGAGDPVIQFRASGVTNASGTAYAGNKVQTSGGTTASTGTASGGAITIGRLNPAGGSIRFDVMRPAVAGTPTEIIGGSAFDGAFFSTFGGGVILAGAYDGFIITHTSNITWTIRVYSEED